MNIVNSLKNANKTVTNKTVIIKKEFGSLLRELKYALYLSVHPFKGFWEIKHEGMGSLRTALILLAAAIIVSIASNFYSGYLFNTSGGLNYNFLKTIGTCLVLYFFWCISNWCLTCFSEGEGTFKDICTATGYALVPYIIIQFILIFLSNFFILEEAVFYNMINTLSLIWTGFLLFTGMLVTHQYSLTRAIVVCIFTVLGMAAMAYLVLLLFNLLQQVFIFITVLVDELIMRLTY